MEQRGSRFGVGLVRLGLGGRLGAGLGLAGLVRFGVGVAGLVRLGVGVGGLVRRHAGLAVAAVGRRAAGFGL